MNSRHKTKSRGKAQGKSGDAQSANDWIYGINAVEGVLQSDHQTIAEVVLASDSSNARIEQLHLIAKKAGLPIRLMAMQQLADLLANERHQGAAVRYQMPPLLDEGDLKKLADQAPEHALFLVLDGIQDPHNLGACIRSAAAAGATAVLFPKDKSAPVTAVTHRASAGTVAKIPLVEVTNLARALETLKAAGVWCYGAAGEGAADWYQPDYRGKVALVLGNEGDGLRRLTRDTCDALVKIHMPGKVESLNVSVAAGVMLFEVVRQRQVAAVASIAKR